MKNKFLEFLVEKKLKDLTYLLKEIDSEKVKRTSNQEQEYPYIDDFFTFLFENNVSQEQLFDSIRRENASYSLAEMIVGSETQNDKNRKTTFEIFRPLLETNVNFYKQVMRVFLLDHKYIKDEFKEKNLEVFNLTVEVGLNKGFFNYFSDTEKQTQVEEYKKVLIEKGIFTSSYDLNETINILKIYEKNNDDPKVANYFSMYNEDVHALIENLTFEKFDELRNKIVKDLEIDPQNEHFKFIKYFNVIVNQLMKVEKEKFLPLLSNEFVKESIISTDIFSNQAFTTLVTTPHLLQALLDNSNEFEHKKLVRKEKYSAGLLVNHFTEKSRDKVYVDNKLLHTILDLIEKHVSDLEENSKDVVMSHIVMNQAVKLETEHKNEIVEKYSKYIVKSLTASNSNSENYFKYDQRLIRLNDIAKNLDSNLYQKLNNKISISQKDTLYKFAQKFNDGKFSLSYEDQKYLDNLTTYINFTNDASVLSVLNADPENPMWKNMVLDYSINKKYYNDENIVTYLLRNLSRKEPQLAIINFIIQDSINNFYEVKFANKDILSYFDKNNKAVLKEVVDTILDTENNFNVLLKGNKVKLKLVQSLDSEDIDKKLNYHLLKQKLEKHTPQVIEKVKVNKI